MADHAPPLPPLPATCHFTPEFRLLLACSWLAPPQYAAQQQAAIAGLCQGGIDWQAFLGLVDRHRVPALAYAALRRHAPALVPAEIRERLKEHSDRARLESLQLAAETVRLAQQGNAAGIDLLPLKGPLLSVELYGDPALRQTHDIDVMVKEADLDRADRLLVAAGYRCADNLSRLSPRRKTLFRSAFNHLTYVHEAKRTKLELHWRYGHGIAAQVASLWEDRQPWEFLQTAFLRPQQEAQLLYLCDHGAQHLWFRLKWLGDVAVLLARAPQPDWDRLCALARRCDLERVLAQAALLVHWLYGVPLPPPLAALIHREQRAVAFAGRALDFMQMSMAELGGIPVMVGSVLYPQKLRHRPQYGRALTSLLLRKTDRSAFSLPWVLFWLYVPLQPVFWVGRHFWRRWGR